MHAIDAARRARDSGAVRLQRLTRAAVVVGVVLGGGFAALAAASTHPKRTHAAVLSRPRPTVAPRRAPVPPLVPLHTADPPPPPPAPSPPAAPPTPTVDPPVAVSGGS